MQKGRNWLIASITIALLSFILMKTMYVIDPMSRETGMLTALVFIFINFPAWLVSGVMFLYGIFLTVREKRVRKNREK